MTAIPPEDPEREQRLVYEILVDTYDAFEEASAWHAYLGDRLNTRFIARWPNSRDLVEFLGLADQDECEAERNVLARIRVTESDTTDERSVPLSEIEPIDAPAASVQAIGDWQYWTARGGTFGSDDWDDEY